MNAAKQDKPEFTIGQLAKEVGVNIETIRYYQRINLIDEPAKPDSGYRKYSTEIADRIIFIKRAKGLGFSLKEISDLLEIGNAHCDDVRVRAEEKRDKIVHQIQDLQVLCDTLEQLINECKTGTNKPHCPLVDSLANTREEIII